MIISISIMIPVPSNPKWTNVFTNCSEATRTSDLHRRIVAPQMESLSFFLWRVGISDLFVLTRCALIANEVDKQKLSPQYHQRVVAQLASA
jgi:hypothetical protein